VLSALKFLQAVLSRQRDGKRHCQGHCRIKGPEAEAFIEKFGKKYKGNAFTICPT
jgi:hypothetical protein